ncbi:MAG: acyltransferase family protein [Deltaproteobacteria bacterium]|nr:acyltransferase family protein [Deltaproteobacteria bacterium]
MTSNPRPGTKPEKVQCKAVTKKGVRCRNAAKSGEAFCAMHLSMQKEERRPAKEPEERFDAKDLAESLAEMQAWMKKRLRGDYEVDEWGFDEEFAELFMPLMKFLYHKYWRVTATGLENVPAEGRALLVANHSGVLPWDGAMIIMAVREDHPQPRQVRALVLSLFFSLPFTGTMLQRIGHVQASPANSERLLNEDELCLVFPEGVKGIGKPFSRRYQLARFGRGGFVRVALKTRSPIIPVSVVGAEEIYPLLVNLRPLASLLGVPYVPITPTFPLLGPLGAVPLPTKWYIHFGEPINIQDMTYRPSEEPLLVTKISNQVRDTIQRQIYERLKTRRSVFFE